jgi:23S rRNA pseudouridine955/2504/2580 synthase
MIVALYEDEEILVLDKPVGLPSQPGEGVRVSLVEAVERDFGFRPYLVHRLDKETAGCVIVAKNAKAAAAWAALVESRRIGKIYRAIVAGEPGGPRGAFDEPVRTRRGDRAASTSWRLLGSFGGGESALAGPFSYLELELGTGRGHQIRIHLASHGLPILGDDRHGDFALNKDLRRAAGLRRLMLHARRLVLPGGREAVSPTPAHFLEFLSLFPGAPAPEASAENGIGAKGRAAADVAAGSRGGESTAARPRPRGAR